MGLFRRIARKVRHVGQKAVNFASVGARKISHTAARAAPLIKKAGEITEVVGALTGQPEIVEFGQTLNQASSATQRVGKLAGVTHHGIEKLRHTKTATDGVSDLMHVGREIYR